MRKRQIVCYTGVATLFRAWPDGSDKPPVDIVIMSDNADDLRRYLESKSLTFEERRFQPVEMRMDEGRAE